MSYTPLYALLAIIAAAAAAVLVLRIIVRARHERVRRSVRAQRARNADAWARRDDHRQP